ncbi:MAG: hypothetical protein ACP5GU_04050 [Thermoprotei archaeon]|jgi:galactokinase
MSDVITVLSFYTPLMIIVIIVVLYSLIIRKYYSLRHEKFEKGLTWFEEAITALSSDNPNYRPVINIMLSNARELSLLSEKKNPKIYRKITKFVNKLERIYIKSKVIDSDTFLRLYFQLIGFKNLLGEDNEHL